VEAISALATGWKTDHFAAAGPPSACSQGCQPDKARDRGDADSGRCEWIALCWPASSNNSRNSSKHIGSGSRPNTSSTSNASRRHSQNRLYLQSSCTIGISCVKCPFAASPVRHALWSKADPAALRKQLCSSSTQLWRSDQGHYGQVKCMRHFAATPPALPPTHTYTQPRPRCLPP